VKSHDPWGNLNAPAHDTYTFVDKTLKEITEEVLMGETTWRARDLAFGSETLSETFSCKLKKGQRIAEFIESLCSSNPTSGSWFRIDALEDPDDNGVIHFYDYNDRVDNAQAKWEYGSDTLDNTVSFQIEHRGLCNKVTVFGKLGLEISVQDNDSIDEYGLVEKMIRRPGVDDTETATKIAYSRLKVTPYTIGSFEPGPNAPQLFDDFDVGDLCRTYFQMSAPNRLTGNVMYYKASDMIPSRVELTIDNSGVENMAFGDGSLAANRHSRNMSQYGGWHTSNAQGEHGV
jgi:hypothetical protein